MSTNQHRDYEFESSPEVSTKEIGYYHSEELLSLDPDSKFSPRTLSPFFIPSKRIPKSYVDAIRQYSDEELTSLLRSEMPLMAKKMTVYPVGSSAYHETQIELYGSVALVDDRAVLDAVTGIGSVLDINAKDEITLNDIAFFLENADIPSKKTFNYEIDLAEDALDPNLVLPTASWYHIEVSELLKHLGLKNSNPNKKTLKKRLERLERMVFIQRFYDDKGREFSNHKTYRIVVDGGLIYLNNKKKLKHKRTPETFTDLLVGISENYEAENEENGFLSRKRLHQVYPILNKTNIMDFLKFLDENTRDFFHTKYLSWAVERYYDHHPEGFSQQNIRYLTGKLHSAVVNEKQLLKDHFNFELVMTPSKKTQKRYGIDYQIRYAPDGKSRKIQSLEEKRNNAV